MSDAPASVPASASELSDNIGDVLASIRRLIAQDEAAEAGLPVGGAARPGDAAATVADLDRSSQRAEAAGRRRDILAEAQALADRLAAGPTLAYRAMKTVLATAATDPLADSLAREAELQTALGASADHLEAVEAFLAKRPPRFTGR